MATAPKEQPAAVVQVDGAELWVLTSIGYHKLKESRTADSMKAAGQPVFRLSKAEHDAWVAEQQRLTGLTGLEAIQALLVKLLTEQRKTNALLARK
jgi:hypothetical protein